MGGHRDVETALYSPDQPTAYFLPLNIIQIGNMSGRAIQQGTNHSTIKIVSNDIILNINNSVENSDKFIDNQVENFELKSELKADIETIK